MGRADDQHLAWLARSFGRADYLPLTHEDLSTISVVAEMVDQYPGTHLFREGEQAEAAYVLQRGDVELYRGGGRHKRVVARVGPGAVIGDIAMFSGTPYISSAKAVEPVVAFRFSRDLLLPELARHPAVCLRWLVSALTQLEKTQRHVLHLMHKTVKGQVADLLLEEMDDRGEVRLSQATIATLLGASRQSVNEALGELRSLGLVETGYRRIGVEDPEGLRAAADAEG